MEIDEFMNKYENDFLTCCRHIYRKYYLDRFIEIDDFIQECYIDIIKKIKLYDKDKSKAITFYYMIVKTRAKMICRDSKAQKIYNEFGCDISINTEYKNNDDLTIEDCLCITKNLFDNVEFEMFIENIFNDKEQTLLNLISEGYSIKDISEIMKIEYFTLIRLKKKVFEKFKRCYLK